MKHVARLLREPLLHFIVIGGLAFVLLKAVSEPRSASLDKIVIEPERVEQLAQGFEAAWRRPPTDEELRALVDDFVREEVYFREAMTLGLDRDDAVIRRRLRQKIEFLVDTSAGLLSPTPDELQAYLDANAERFRRPPSLAFEQVYFGESPDASVITASLSALQSDPAADATELGERTLLPAELSLSLPGAVDGVFGAGFFERIVELPVDGWGGPVESAYGVHLVRVIQRVPASMPVLNEVRDDVVDAWTVAKALELRDRHFARMRERYVVEIREPLAAR